MKSKVKEAQIHPLLVGENLVELSISATTTQNYSDIIRESEDGIECKIVVARDELPDGYKTLRVESHKQCISFKNDDGTISYRILTHKFIGKTMEFGAVFTPKGTVELYSFLSDPDPVECKFIASKKVSAHVVDPMYAIISEDTIYVVYNAPSQTALNSTTANRKPATEGMTSVASGAPNIVSFNLVTDEQERIFPKMKPMVTYASHMIAVNNEPALLVANVFDVEAPKENSPTFASLFSAILSDEDKESPAYKQFPVGVSVARFVKKAEISQIPPEGDSERGVSSVILKKSNEVGENLVDIVTEDDKDSNAVKGDENNIVVEVTEGSSQIATA